jgi:hypothetical protein
VWLVLKWPFDPFDTASADFLLKSLLDGGNALLEHPTGSLAELQGPLTLE